VVKQSEATSQVVSPWICLLPKLCTTRKHSRQDHGLRFRKPLPQTLSNNLPGTQAQGGTEEDLSIPEARPAAVETKEDDDTSSEDHAQSGNLTREQAKEIAERAVGHRDNILNYRRALEIS